jgi:hypothetical protein
MEEQAALPQRAGHDRSTRPADPPVDLAAYDNSPVGRNAALEDVLRSLARSWNTGRPMGRGTGLEAASGWVRQILPDLTELRATGQRAVRAILAGLDSSAISPDDLDRVMGAYAPTTQVWSEHRNLSLNKMMMRDSCDVMLGFSGHNNLAWQRWLTNDEFASQVVAYLQVAMLRLVAEGRQLSY